MVRERLDLEKAEETPNATVSTSGPGGGHAEPSRSQGARRRNLNPALLAEKYVSDPANNAQEDLRIADDLIPRYIRHIFELMKLWAMSEIEGSPARRPTPAELERMGHYLETWKAVAKCPADQMRLYMFAHILQATTAAENKSDQHKH